MPKLLFRMAGIALLAALSGCAQAALGQRSIVVAPQAVVSTVVARPASFSYPSGCVLDAAGNLYIADSNNNAIRKISTSGVVTTLAGGGGTNPGTSGFTDGLGTAARFASPASMDIDASGNLYVADTGNNAIRKVAPEGRVTTIAGDGTPAFRNGQGTAAQFSGPTAVALDGNGNLFVVDTGNHTLRQIDSTRVVTTVIGAEDYSNSGYADPVNKPLGTALGCFTFPYAIVYDRKHSTAASTILYLADSGNHVVRKVIISGGSVSVSSFAGSGGNTGFADGTASARFSWISGIAFDPSGNLVVSDLNNNAVSVVDTNGKVTRLAGGGAYTGAMGYADASGGSALLSQPGGLAVDRTGTIYVCDELNNAIRKVTPAGKVSTYAGYHLLDSSSAAFPGFEDGRIDGPALVQPFALALDAAGNLFVADLQSSAIWKGQPQQGTWQVFSSGLQVSGVPLSGFGGVAVDSNGRAYVSASAFNQIVMTSGGSNCTLIVDGAQNVDEPYGIKLAGDLMYFANNNKGKIGAVDLKTNSVTYLPNSGTIASPTGLLVSDAGEIYATSFDDNTVVKFRPGDATAAVVVGKITDFGNINGTTVGATLHWPQGLAFDRSGNLYIADTYSNMIRKVTPDGLVFTVAGLGPSLSGVTDGSKDVARFNQPTDVVVDADGNLYVADSGSGLIRKITFQ